MTNKIILVLLIVIFVVWMSWIVWLVYSIAAIHLNQAFSELMYQIIYNWL